MANELKSDSILDLVKKFLETNESLELKKKINLVYQFNISPKVPTTHRLLVLV